MKTNSTHRTNANLSNLYNNDNCDCYCHYPEDMEISRQNLPPNPQSHTSIQRDIASKKIITQNKDSDCLCLCDEVCSCPCHCVTCLCCPCVKEKKSDDYYKNLYSQIKSELEIEKRRNDRMKFDRELNINILILIGPACGKRNIN